MAKTQPAPTTDNEATDLSHEDAWAFTPEHQQAIERALADSAAGRVYRLPEEDLIQLMDEAEQARREGREFRLPREWLKVRDATHRAAS
jgi:hypothetical protein